MFKYSTLTPTATDEALDAVNEGIGIWMGYAEDPNSFTPCDHECPMCDLTRDLVRDNLDKFHGAHDPSGNSHECSICPLLQVEGKSCCTEGAAYNGFVAAYDEMNTEGMEVNARRVLELLRTARKQIEEQKE